MTTYSMKLLKCPACGGPIDPPSGESSMKCPYCGNAVVIPESLRKTESTQQQSQGSLFTGLDMNSMLGYGAHWAEVVQLAQGGKKEEAVKKYMSFSSISESDARRTVEGLASSQVYEVSANTGFGTAYTTDYVAPMMKSYADTAKTVTKWSLWFTCGIMAFVFAIIIIVTVATMGGVFASIWAAFR